MAKTPIYPHGGAPPIAPYSPGILSNGILYVSGVIATNEKGDIAHPGDAGQQTLQVIESIKSVVEAAGGTLADIVCNTIFIRDWSDYGSLNTVYAEYFGKPAPARYCVQCSLVKPGALVEISSIAHISKNRSQKKQSGRERRSADEKRAAGPRKQGRSREGAVVRIVAQSKRGT